MRQELEDFYIFTVTTKENVDTLYNGYNVARKQLEPLWPHLG